MAQEAAKAVRELAGEGIDCELIDPRTIKPLDIDLILRSVAKTGRLVIADVGWYSWGWAAEVAALVAERAFHSLKAPVRRVALPDCPAPASKNLEKAYYPTAEDIVQAVRKIAKQGFSRSGSEEILNHEEMADPEVKKMASIAKAL
jgi:pyruvate dehydrogenase E1 component beta subunit